MPIIDVIAGGQHIRALVDTGCSRSVVAPWVCAARGDVAPVGAVNGHDVTCIGSAIIPIVVDSVTSMVDCVVAEEMLDGIDACLGVDFIDKLGGLVYSNGGVCFPHAKQVVAAAVNEPEPNLLRIDDTDFVATFDGKRWVVKWCWRDGKPPELVNTVQLYKSTQTEKTQVAFNQEIDRWISKGWLKECTNQVEVKGVIPLMAVVQANKDKVRPVMDYREVNEYVENHPGMDAAVCNETLRRWRKLPGPLKMVDLKSAYLQVHVDESLWPYQRVVHEGKVYCLTRLGFGLNCAPKIMSKILQTVLAQDDKVKSGTDSYIDDIIVNENEVSVTDVVVHLAKFGLEAKHPEDLDGGRVLGLSLLRSGEGNLEFRRGNEVPSPSAVEVVNGLTRRRLFSICGQLVGHYPVCGWLHVACSFVKRESEGDRWDDPIGERAAGMMREVLARVSLEDPVRGQFHVDNCRRGRVWCDASSIALGVAVEIGGQVVEDAAWLRKRDDHSHINLAELDAVVKGLNLATQWGLIQIELLTDSVTVQRWLTTVLEDNCRIRVSGMSEVLVKRRLSLVSDVVRECGLVVKVSHVSSEMNKADKLTRVSRRWLREPVTDVSCASLAERLHGQHHFGVDRTLYLAKLVDPDVNVGEVKAVVRRCGECRSVDPAPARHVPGSVGVEECWSRLALDVTHYRGKSYLTMIDCGPSRFALWREVRSENAVDVSFHMEQVFRERGPPDEVLMDNSTAFRSFRVAELCREWNVNRRFRAAYRPEGNSIVERSHRTIKRMAARSDASPLKMVFWYNLAAKDGLDGDTAPCQMVHGYSWRHPEVVRARDEREELIDHPYRVGDGVLVKPPDGRCSSHWSRGRVSRLVSANNVEVDGVPRHVLDIRRLFVEEDDDDDDGEAGATDAPHEQAPPEMPHELRRPTRARRPPVWHQDYEM